MVDKTQLSKDTQVDGILAEIKRTREREKYWYWRVYFKLRYRLPFLLFSAFPIWLEWQYQRLATGFPHYEAYGFCDYCARWSLPRLKYLRDNNNGFIPNDFVTQEEWKEILDKIIFAFESIVNEEVIDVDESRKIQPKIDEGLRLFGKYFQDLCD